MSRTDPTRTKTLRKAFSSEINKRFLWLRGMVRKSLVDRDVLALKENIALPGSRAFDFPRSSEKVEAFMRWLGEMEDRGIFSLRKGVSRSQSSNVKWADVYIDSAYRQGMRRGNHELRKAGYSVPSLSEEGINVLFSQPVHADRVGLIYTRVFSELKGVTDAMDQQISRILAQGMAEGVNPREIADRITSSIRDIQKQRALKIARTEVVRAHHHASMALYEEAEVEGVALLAEWSTAGDRNVCEFCNMMASQGPYNLNEAWGMIPAHPNCRCVMLPLTLGDVEHEMGLL